MDDPLPTGGRLACALLFTAAPATPVALALALLGSACANHTTTPSAVPGGVAPSPSSKVAVTPTAARLEAKHEHVALGEVTVVVMTSRTAGLFHMIDQLSLWSPFSHSHYQKWRPPGAAPDALLARHAKLRQRRGWGQGLEAALYVDDPDYGHALDAAVARGILDADDAAEEKQIFDGLAPLLEARLTEHDARTNELVDALRRESSRFARLFGNWLRLLGLPAPVPFALTFVPCPGQGAGGGGANGGAVVVELPQEGAVEPTLTTVAHESIHVLMRPKLDMVRERAARCGEHLDTTTVGEAFAYATAPGMFSWGHGKDALERDAQRTPLGTPYRGFYEVAIGLEPELRKSLLRTEHDRGDFPALLDVVCEAWKTRPH